MSRCNDSCEFCHLTYARLRTCFEEHPAGEITQIALWHSYNECFAGAPLTHPLMTAKDFITNVSTTFAGANAQVVGTNPPKYTIRGICPRKVPVDNRGREYLMCRWRTQPGMDDGECRDFFMDAEGLWQHVLEKHLGFGVFKDSDTSKPQLRPPTDELAGKYSCHWSGCTHFSSPGTSSPQEITNHIQTHLPDVGPRAEKRRAHNRAIDSPGHTSGMMNGYTNGVDGGEDQRVLRRWLSTPLDNQNHPEGLAFAAVLVLRNLARQLAKVEAMSKQLSGKDGGDSLVSTVFSPVKERLYFVAAYNHAIREGVGGVLRLIGKGGG